jgi:hypothetical protein
MDEVNGKTLAESGDRSRTLMENLAKRSQQRTRCATLPTRQRGHSQAVQMMTATEPGQALRISLADLRAAVSPWFLGLTE